MEIAIRKLIVAELSENEWTNIDSPFLVNRKKGLKEAEKIHVDLTNSDAVAFAWFEEDYIDVMRDDMGDYIIKRPDGEIIDLRYCDDMFGMGYDPDYVEVFTKDGKKYKFDCNTYYEALETFDDGCGEVEGKTPVEQCQYVFKDLMNARMINEPWQL